MECKRCVEELTAFLDHELKPDLAQQVYSHVSCCASCAAELRSLKEAGDFFAVHSRELEPRTQSWNVIQARISAEQHAGSRFGFFLNRPRIAIAAVALLTGAFALGYFQYQENQREILEEYISRYEQDRERQRKSRTVFWDTQGVSGIENPYANNPFIEIKAVVDGNPFRSEGR